MLLQRFMAALAHQSGTPRSFHYKLLVQILGALLFLAGVPALLYLAGLALETHVLAGRWEEFKTGAAYLSIALGLLEIGRASCRERV